MNPIKNKKKSGSGKPMGRCRMLLLALPAILILAGCAAMTETAPEPVAMSSVPPPMLWQQLAAAEEKPPALKALARIDIATPSRRYPLKAAILLQYPDRLRLESIPLFGPPDFYLTFEKDTMKVLLPQEGKYYIGAPSPAQLAAFLPFFSYRFQLSDMLALLRGTVPRFQGPDVTLKGFLEGKYDRLEVYRGENKIQAFWLEQGSGALHQAALWGRDGELRYRARFEDRGSIKETGDFPAKISVVIGDSNPVTLTLRYTDLQILDGIEAALFALEIPDGMEPVRYNEE
ncbi:MAG: hypothetical protein A4E70_00942 [Syntrophus sp. PtaU1.Bin005]|jgi:hypothetical protein|uniref:hypothetical protein n=1 Tax=Syntrophus sp. (in: bacteria) TaxID=48412 RepID=UPI0009D118D4|nr:MAG: hypothetical protein A4E70_00942 [Syntrophus sp. PtaU1.Bin005]